MALDGNELPAQPNNSLIGGLECLEAVVAAGRPVGTREVSRLLEMNHTRVSRLVKTLTHLELLERSTQGRYRPGPGIHVLAALSLRGSPLLTIALPHARHWWEKGFTVTLGVLWRKNICYLLHARPDRPFDQAIGGHEVAPAIHSSAGLVLMAAKPPAQVADWSFEARPGSADVAETLQARLDRVRRQGYGSHHNTDGTVSLGVPVGQPPVAGFAVSKKGIAARDEPPLAEAVRATAEQIQAEMSPKP